RSKSKVLQRFRIYDFFFWQASYVCHPSADPASELFNGHKGCCLTNLQITNSLRKPVTLSYRDMSGLLLHTTSTHHVLLVLKITTPGLARCSWTGQSTEERRVGKTCTSW